MLGFQADPGPTPMDDYISRGLRGPPESSCGSQMRNNLSLSTGGFLQMQESGRSSGTSGALRTGHQCSLARGESPWPLYGTQAN